MESWGLTQSLYLDRRFPPSAIRRNWYYINYNVYTSDTLYTTWGNTCKVWWQPWSRCTHTGRWWWRYLRVQTHLPGRSANRAWQSQQWGCRLQGCGISVVQRKTHQLSYEWNLAANIKRIRRDYYLIALNFLLQVYHTAGDSPCYVTPPPLLSDSLCYETAKVMVLDLTV